MQTKKITRKIIFSFAALSFLVLAASPVRAAVVEPIESCVLNKPIKLRTRTTEITINQGIKITPSPTISVLSKGGDITSNDDAKLKEWGILCTINVINTIVGWIVLIVTVLSTVLLIYAGFLWMTGGDNPEFKQRSGKIILAALIGFGIVILGNVIPALISGILLP